MTTKTLGQRLGARRLAIGLSLAVTASGFALAAAPTVHAADHCDATVAAADVQTAVTAAAPGHTICVMAGVYVGPLTVNQTDLTLKGPNAGTNAMAARVPEAVIQGMVSIGAGADGITVDGFRVEGHNHSMRGRNTRFVNNVMVGTGGHGMTTGTTAPVRDTSFEIVGNSFAGFNQAIRLDGNDRTLSVLVQHNHLSGNSRGVQTFAGLHLGPVGNDLLEDSLIVDNVVTGNTAVGIRLAAGGFNVHRNEIVGNAIGLHVGHDPVDPLFPKTDTYASCNWWGSDDGPGGDGPGNGDALEVEDGWPVNVPPWRTGPDGPCDGPLVPAVAQKQAVIDELTLLLSTGDKKADKEIEKAIKAIAKSIDPKFWADDDTPEKDKVFKEEKKAVKALEKALETEPAVADAINTLVALDRQFAVNAINAAAGGDQKRIDKANEELAKGDAEVADGEFDKAIDRYKKAWKEANKA